MKDKDCFCYTCSKEMHHLGVARHRAMHRDNNEDCDIGYADGSRYMHYFSEESRAAEEAD